MKLSYLKDNKMGKLFEKATVFPLETAIEYTAGGVVSKQIIKSLAGNITLFSFDEGQGLTEHTAQFDAMIQILDGEAKIQIDGKSFTVKKGESIILPEGHPHALQADIAFKMLLTMIKG